MCYFVDTNRLKKRMIDCKIETVFELSERTGINRNTLSSILDGKSKPSTASIEKIMTALSISPEDAGTVFFKKKLA